MTRPKLRARLVDRMTELRTKIQRTEDEAAQQGYSCRGAQESQAGLAANSILEESLAPFRHELARAESALRRLDRNEADCCIHCGRDIGASAMEETPYAASCESCAQDFPLDYAGLMRIQHRSLRSAMLELLEVAARIRARQFDELDIDVETCAYAVLLHEFARELPAHFASEEKGGYMQEVIETAPRFQREVERLEREHVVLRAKLEAVKQAFDRASSRGERAGALHGLEDLSTDLFHHEESENRVVQSAFLDDLGGG